MELYGTNYRKGGLGDSVVKKVWNDIVEGDQEDIMSAEMFGRYKGEVEERIERQEG